MQTFQHTVQDRLGIHARPAGLLVKEIKQFDSNIRLSYDGKTIEASKLFAVMGLGIKCGDTFEVHVEGSDEEEAAKAVRAFLESNL